MLPFPPKQWRFFKCRRKNKFAKKFVNKTFFSATSSQPTVWETMKMTHSLPRSRWINFKNKVEAPLEWKLFFSGCEAFTILFVDFSLVQIKPHQKSIHAEVALHGVIVINKFSGKDESLSAFVKAGWAQEGTRILNTFPKLWDQLRGILLGRRGEGSLWKLFPKSAKFSSCSAPFIPSPEWCLRRRNWS